MHTYIHTYRYAYTYLDIFTQVYPTLCMIYLIIEIYIQRIQSVYIYICIVCMHIHIYIHTSIHIYDHIRYYNKKVRWYNTSLNFNCPGVHIAPAQVLDPHRRAASPARSSGGPSGGSKIGDFTKKTVFFYVSLLSWGFFAYMTY
jgi:hypothetical protein